MHRALVDRDHYSIGIGHMELAEAELLERLEARLALRADAGRLRPHQRIGDHELVEVFLEGVEALDLEAEMVERRTLDATAEEIRNAPRHDVHGDLPVRERMPAVDRRRVLERQLEYVGVELRQPIRLDRAQRKMREAPLLLPGAGLVDLGAVLEAGLRQIEIVAGRIVDAECGEWAVARALDDLDLGVFLGYPRTHPLDVLDLDAEVIEPGLAAGHARIDVHADIAVADRHGGGLEPGVDLDLQAEQRAVEDGQQGIIVRNNGNVIEPGEHSRLLSWFIALVWRI